MAGATWWVGALVGLAVVLFWVALGLGREERYAEARIEQAMAGHLVAPTLELEVPFAERVLRPLLRQLLRRIGALSPGRNIESLRRQLLVAGSPGGLGALDFIGLRLLVTLLGTAALSAVALSGPMSFLRRFIILLGGALLCAELPRFWLKRRMAQRRKQITLALPDALDMLTVCIDAGMGLESAFMRIGQLWDNALAHEFRRAVMEMGVGISWPEAMRNLVYRTDVPDLSSLVAVLLQADQLGFSIGDTLHAQSDQLRVRRRQRAQEAARAAPLKMLFPMVFFILPATLAVVIGPAIRALVETFAQIG